MSTAKTERYTAVAIILHWTIAALILGLIAVGLWMAGVSDRLDAGETVDISPALLNATFQMHKTLGLMVLALTAARIVWRLANPPPPMPEHMAWWEKAAASAVHLAFYFVMIGLPMSGWAMVSASARGGDATYLFMQSWLAWPHLPVAVDAETEAGLKQIHWLLAMGTLGLFALHVAAALKHQFVNRDALIARLAPKLFGETAPPRRSGRGVAPAFGLAAVLMVAGLGWGWAAQRPIAQDTASVDAGGATPARSLAASTDMRWTVDHDASAITFAGQYEGARYQAAFEDWTASIAFDPADLANASAVVTVNAGAARTGVRDIDARIAGADGFDPDAYGPVRFETTAFRALGGEAYEADALLHIRGVAHEVTLPFIVAIEGDRARMAGVLTLDRAPLEIGMQNDPRASYLGREITVEVSVEATRAP